LAFISILPSSIFLFERVRVPVPPTQNKPIIFHKSIRRFSAPPGEIPLRKKRLLFAFSPEATPQNGFEAQNCAA
jgi:hypothetical protein